MARWDELESAIVSDSTDDEPLLYHGEVDHKSFVEGGGGELHPLGSRGHDIEVLRTEEQLVCLLLSKPGWELPQRIAIDQETACQEVVGDPHRGHAIPAVHRRAEDVALRIDACYPLIGFRAVWPHLLDREVQAAVIRRCDLVNEKRLTPIRNTLPALEQNQVQNPGRTARCRQVFSCLYRGLQQERCFCFRPQNRNHDLPVDVECGNTSQRRKKHALRPFLFLDRRRAAAQLL